MSKPITNKSVSSYVDVHFQSSYPASCKYALLISKRKITHFIDFDCFFIKGIDNGNNSVGRQSSLRGNDLGWWLDAVNGPSFRLCPAASS